MERELEEEDHHHHHLTLTLTPGSQLGITTTLNNNPNNDCFTGAWSTATVLPTPPNHHHSPTTTHQLYIQYNDRDIEYVTVWYDLVEAFYRNGLWTGVAQGVIDDYNVLVSFHNLSHEVGFCCSQRRVRRNSLKQGTTGWMFTAYNKVEVSFDGESLRDVWFPATILKNIGSSAFLVEYKRPGVGDEEIIVKVKVAVDCQHMRPLPPHLKDRNFVLSEKVEAYFDFGWWSGVVTKEVGKNRYNVFFEHTKKEREFVHSKLRPRLEWKDGKWFNTSQGGTVVRTYHSLIYDDQFEQETAVIGEQSSDATQGKIVQKVPDDETVTVAESDIEPPGVLLAPLTVVDQGDMVMRTDHSLIDNQIEQATPFVARQSPDATSEMNKRQKILDSNNRSSPKGEAGQSEGFDSVVSEMTEQAVNKINKGDTVMMTDQSLIGNQIEQETTSVLGKRSPDKETVTVAETVIEPQNVPLAPLTVADQEEIEGDTASGSPKKKRGSPTTAVTDSQDAFKEKADKSLLTDSTRRNLEASVEKSLLMMCDDDQPISILFKGKRSLKTTNGPERTMEQSLKACVGPLETVQRDIDSGNLPFVKNSPLWETIESMESFKMLPQKPHFNPLLEVDPEGSREGLAISLMVIFSSVVDKTLSLRLDDPRSKIEDHLKTLVNLENNGFNVEVIRERLTGLLLVKDKKEELVQRSNGFVEKMKEQSVEGKKFDEEIVEIDGHIRELKERRKEVSLKYEKIVSEVVVMKSENEVIKQEIRKACAEFHRLAAAPFVANNM